MAGEALLKTPAIGGTAGGSQLDRGVTTPDIWSTKLNVKLYERTFLKEITNNDWENEAKGPGDTVFIREMPDIPIRRYVPGQPMKRDRVRYKAWPLKLNKTASFALEIEDVEKVQSDMRLQADFTTGAAKNMDEYMCADVLQTVYASAGIKYTVTTPTSDAFFQSFMKALMLLGKNKVDIEDTSQLFCVSSYEGFYLLGTGAQTKAADMGNGVISTVLTGKINGKVAGIRTYFSNQLAVVGGKTQVLIGHKKAITWAMQMDRKLETLRNPDAPGDIIRGFCLYGFEVANPNMLACLDVQWPAI